MNYCSEPKILKAGLWRSIIACFLVEHIWTKYLWPPNVDLKLAPLNVYWLATWVDKLFKWRKFEMSYKFELWFIIPSLSHVVEWVHVVEPVDTAVSALSADFNINYFLKKLLSLHPGEIWMDWNSSPSLFSYTYWFNIRLF